MENNDDFFIYRIKNYDDDRAAMYLLNRYQTLAKRFAEEMYGFYRQPGIVSDDFYSIALEQYFRCIKRYEPGKNSFYPYWRRISHRAVLRYIIAFSRSSTPNSVSLDSLIDPGKRESMTYGDVIGKNDEHIIGDINAKSYVTAISENDKIGLSKEEKKVIAEVSNFKTADEIAYELNKPVSHIRYVIKTAKTKIAKLKGTNT